MGNCQTCLLFFKNNKVTDDSDLESLSDSEFYTERVTKLTHIVADIHELTRYKVKPKVL